MFIIINREKLQRHRGLAVGQFEKSCLFFETDPLPVEYVRVRSVYVKYNLGEFEARQHERSWGLHDNL